MAGRAGPCRKRILRAEIAGTLGVVTHSDPLDATAVRIGSHAGLLVLDTCEHVLDACADAAHRLPRACPRLTGLATSRQALAVPGEVSWPVPPLPVPGTASRFDEVAASEAVQLFRQRCREGRPGFELDGVGMRHHRASFRAEALLTAERVLTPRRTHDSVES